MFTVLVQQRSEALALVKNYSNETVCFLDIKKLPVVTTVLPAFFIQ